MVFVGKPHYVATRLSHLDTQPNTWFSGISKAVLLVAKAVMFARLPVGITRAPGTLHWCINSCYRLSVTSTALNSQESNLGLG